MDVSVIIPSLHSPVIDQVLASLRTQTYGMSRAEVLVVGLDRYNLVLEDDLVRFVSTDGPVTAPVARNIGIRRSRGKCLAFVDADCIPSAEWLSRMMAYQRQGLSVVSGGVTFPADDYWSLCYNVAMFHDFLPSAPAGERPNLPTLNLCVDRATVEAVGLLDETLPRGQDTEWTLRMRAHGYRLHFAPDATVTHLPSPGGLRGILSLWYRSGFYSARIRKQYRGLVAAPRVLTSSWLTLLLSPIISSLVAVRLFARNPYTRRYLHTVPIVYLSRIAWCLGAAKQARDPEAVV